MRTKLVRICYFKYFINGHYKMDAINLYKHYLFLN